MEGTSALIVHKKRRKKAGASKREKRELCLLIAWLVSSPAALVAVMGRFHRWMGCEILRMALSMRFAN